jgi:UDP-glucuronate decarboxylase
MRENDYRVLPQFASRLIGGRRLAVYGSGNQTRTYCYVADAMNGFIRTMLNGVPGEPYNIGNPTPEISVIELVQRLAEVEGHEIDFDLIEYPDTYPADEPNRRCPDIRKARIQLEYEPRVELNDGLGRFMDWARGVYKGDA